MADQIDGPLRILGLDIENLKRIRAVKIAPAPGANEIAGNNGQGKTSVLHGIKWALSHGREIQWEPVRKGEEQAHVTLDIGNDKKVEFTVTRFFTINPDQEGAEYDTKLLIQRPNGQKLSSSFLQSLVGEHAMDPVWFIKATAKERIATLKGFVPNFDFKAHEKKRVILYDDRHSLGQVARRLRSVAEELELRRPKGDVPEIKIELAPITAKFARVEEQVREVEAEKRRRAELGSIMETLRSQMVATNRRIEALLVEAERLRGEVVEGEATLRTFEEDQAAWPPLPEPPTTADIEAEMKAANEHNTLVDVVLKIVAAAGEAREAEEKHAEADAALQAHDELARKAVEDAQLPVRGMTLGDEDVRLHGVPFEQASDAQQLRAALALAIAGLKDLRVILIREGSLLDHAAMETIRQVCEEASVQAWIERVLPDSQDAIIIEEGQVKK